MAARATNPTLLQRLAKQIRSKIPRANRLLAFPARPEIDEGLMAKIEHLAMQRTTPLSLLDLYRYGNSPSPAQRLRNAQFLHLELPRRIAQRVVELRNLPIALSEKRGIQNVMGWYAGYVDELLSFAKPMDAEQEYDFTCLLASILCDHTSVPRALASGIQEYRVDMTNEELLEDPGRDRIEQVLSGFYTARIGLRFLVEHHIVSNNARDGYSGIIASNCNPKIVSAAAANDVEKLCRAALGSSPPIKILGKQNDVFTYVPSHLYYMVSETLKNSCRAVVEKHDPAYAELREAGLGSSEEEDRIIRAEARKKALAHSQLVKLPTVKVVVAMGDEDVTIKVADEGGGVPRSDLRLLWTFFYTTFPTPASSSSPSPTSNSNCNPTSAPSAPPPPISTTPSSATTSGLPDAIPTPPTSTSTSTAADGGGGVSPLIFPNVGTEPVLAGHGMGLPLSRIYARYFGGDLEVKSLEGFGMDSYLHLCKLGDRCEDLGLQVMRSPASRDSTIL